ncbi:nucleoporin subcomplex protein binding to Pom34-domain-containing protein [Podospora australis]|uniref:Nucleoporin subcomplex protein binding to Pom34-domain-containing protein n=1 Tax=Podospora australis TaxID=1536484 RepID=A0AAN6X967_9PEZI|nr:nucleoporin subcomplex protein binding to Pom34-domain-containing protein [Podospora australis]
MAALTDRTYFPPLEECLKGKNIILSWRLVASALEDSTSDRLTSAAVSAFLRDGYVQQLIKQPTKTFEPPTNQSKLDFETKTGAINLVPSPTDPFDLKVIKQDAQWLSKNANINEVAALRIVVVEYQSRAQSHLTGPLSTQDVANIQEAAGVSDAQASSILSLLNVTTVADAESNWAEFESEEKRRQRLLTTYLSERRSFLSSADALITFLLHSVASTITPAAEELRHDILKDAFEFDERSINGGDTAILDALAPVYIALLGVCIDQSQTGPATVEESVMTEQLELDWVRTALTEAIHAMSLAFQIVDLSGLAFHQPDVVAQWFTFVDNYSFLDYLGGGSHELIAELMLPLRSLVAAISLKLLHIDRALLYLAQDVDLVEHEEPYLASTDVLTAIHNAVAAAAAAGVATAMPVAFAWSLIIHQMHLGYQERAERRDLLNNQRAQAGFEIEYSAPPTPPENRARRNSGSSIVSIEQSPYDLFLTNQNLERDIQLAESMAMAATARGQVYEVISEMAVCLGLGQTAAFRPVIGARLRLVFQDLLKRSSHVVGYQSEPVSCLLQLLSASRQYWDISAESYNAATLDIYTRMISDESLNNEFTSQAQNRFPYEFLPFSQICRSLSAALVTDKTSSELILGLLTKTPSLTLDWNPEWDRSYELVFEEENTNSFRLDRDIDLFSPAINRRSDPQERFTIPAGTFGRFVTDVGRVAKLDFEHSTLALLGKRLEVNLQSGIYDTWLGDLSDDEVAESVSLLATLLRAEVLRGTTNPSKANHEGGVRILEEASRVLPRNNDIIKVVCGILSNLIEKDPTELDGSKIATMTACLQFLHAIIPICASRVWSFMASCGLINSEARSGRLSRITGNLDMFSERFAFLDAAVKVFSSLVDNAMTSAVQRKTAGNSNGHSRASENSWASEKIISQVSLSIAQAVVDIFENSATWRFPSEVDRSILVRDVVGIMHKLISHTFTIGSPESSKNLTSCLGPAAKYIVEGFLSTSSSALRFQPLLATLLITFQIPDSTLYPKRSRIVSERLTTTVAFATTLLRVADFVDLPPAAVQTQLFKSASIIARLPAIRHSFKLPAIALLSALVESAGKGSGEPPSLLGYLGPQISRSFIQIASQLDRPFNRIPEVVSTWKFFSVIMRNRQQWMANCLLTGKTPREALKGDAKISQLSPDSVLNTALEQLRSISTLESRELLAILDFFTSAQNYWAWTIFALQKDKAFLGDLRAYVKKLQAPSLVAKTNPEEAGYQARIAAYIAETFAMQLYHLRQMRQEKEFASEVLHDLDYFLRNGVQVSGYNNSLHSNFARNFSKRYPGIEVDDFKRTGLVPRDLGTQYYYALDFAEDMLGYDSGWAGAGAKKNGFRKEMETANLNLSLVEAEVALFHAWEYLILELSICLLPREATIAKQMVQVSEQCLESNQRPPSAENIFVRLAHSRANLSLTLLQRLAEASHLPRDITQLLTNVASAIQAVDNPFSKENISYFRTLLKTLFVTLRGSRHSANAVPSKTATHETPAAVIQLVLTTLDRVVAQSFRTLASLVHEPDSPTTPEDLALITAILQACLAVPGIEQCQIQVLNIMSSHDVFQVATSLFSWSDKLAGNGDPIYGELSILFLLELSSLPSIAEQLACDGVLGHLTSANIAGYLRRSNVSPFTDNAGAARCYSVWAKGILPLLLNILGALGPTIAPEVAFVLNQFPNLLKSSVERFEAPGMSRTASKDSPHFITLVAISEIHSLALLTRVLGALRMNNTRDIPAVSWDAANVLENVEFWMTSRKVLRERLLPLGAREMEWRATKAKEGSGCETVLEEKVVAMLDGVRDVLTAGEGDE